MNNEMFFEPKTNQYGSHMVMTNVHKPLKTKYINIDTKFRDEYNYSQLANYNITLPERITEVTSMRVVSAEIPISFYNISEDLGNNYFYLTYINNVGSNTTTKINLPNGNYTNKTLGNLSISIDNINIFFNYLDTSSNSINSITVYPNLQINLLSSKKPQTYTFNFATNPDGTADKFNFRYKLGWLLGFRNPTYTLTTSTTTATLKPEGFIDAYGPKYLYLAIEEFNKGNQSSFVTPVNKSLLNKNIIARITLNKNGGFDFGSVLPANNFNGLLMSDTRSYTGKIDLMKLNVQLLTENGIVVNLNGFDFSLCLEVTHE
jgi:hypothetical protein